MLEKLKKNYYFAVVRGESMIDAMEVSRYAVKGGIRNIEITYTTPAASEVIEKLSDEFRDQSDVVIGAGTVMTVEIAKEAIEAGAAFLVSPHFSPEIQSVAKAADVLYFPGCATTTEIVSAMNMGCQIMKIFPGGVVGPQFIKDVHGPIPQVNLMPSGGVSIENVAEWRRAGACAVGIGSALVCNIATEGYESVERIAKSFVAAGGEYDV